MSGSESLGRLLRSGDLAQVELKWDATDKVAWATAVFASDRWAFDDVRYCADTFGAAVMGLSSDVASTFLQARDEAHQEIQGLCAYRARLNQVMAL